MPSGHGNVKPESRLYNMKEKRLISKKIFFIIYTLLVLIIGLVLSNLLIYRLYEQNKYASDIAFKRVYSITSEKEYIVTQNEDLKKQNDTLKQMQNEITIQTQELRQQIESIKKVNDQLKLKNKQLIEENIALQNSLKMAASVGIKPRNYSAFNKITSRGEIDRGSYIGRFLGTAYTPSKEECGNNLGITNSGKPIIPGISIAVDKKYWSFGTVFYIKGLGYAVAMDTGSAIKGKYRFDFAVFDKEFAKKLGQRHWDVYLIKEGDGTVKDISF